MQRGRVIVRGEGTGEDGRIQTSQRGGPFEGWARAVGYFDFQRLLARSVEHFRETFGFDLRLRAEPPGGHGEEGVAFWISLPGWWGGQKEYALVGRIRGVRIHVALGWGEQSGTGLVFIPYREVADLGNLNQLTELDLALWFRGLVRMHCDKI